MGLLSGLVKEAELERVNRIPLGKQAALATSPAYNQLAGQPATPATGIQARQAHNAAVQSGPRSDAALHAKMQQMGGKQPAPMAKALPTAAPAAPAAVPPAGRSGAVDSRNTAINSLARPHNPAQAQAYDSQKKQIVSGGQPAPRTQDPAFAKQQEKDQTSGVAAQRQQEMAAMNAQAKQRPQQAAPAQGGQQAALAKLKGLGVDPSQGLINPTDDQRNAYAQYKQQYGQQNRAVAKKPAPAKQVAAK